MSRTDREAPRPEGPGREALGKRARQVYDLLGRRGELTAAEVWDALPDLPSYSAARAVLRVLEEKGLASHRREGGRYVYHPTEAPHRVRRSAVRHLVDTLFAGSVSAAMQTLVDVSGGQLEAEEAEALRTLIERAERGEDQDDPHEGEDS